MNGDRIAVAALLLALLASARPAAAQEDSAADALARAAILEQAAELPAALRAAQKAVGLGGGYDAHVRTGWLSYRLGDLPGALAAYRAARRLRPEGEEALLGETLVLSLQEDWPALRAAARELVMAHPLQVWGWIRLGLAALQRGELQRAREAYRAALELRPDTAEALLGLGFVARAEGKLDEARRLCRMAADRLPPGDERVTECLAPPPRRVTVVPSAWGMVAGYTDYYTRDQVWAGAAEAEVLWDAGPGFRVGVAVARTGLRFGGRQGRDFTQVMPGAGLSWRGKDWSVGGGYLFIWQSGAGAETQHVAALGVLGWLGDWGLGLDAAGYLVPPDETLLQYDAHVVWGRPGATVQVAATPSVQWWPLGPAGLEGTAYVSGELGVVWRPVAALALELGGWYGRRRSFVEAGGRWVWNGDDVFQAGLRLGAVVQLARPVALALRLRDDFGIEQAGREFGFQLLTAQLGLILTL